MEDVLPKVELPILTLEDGKLFIDYHGERRRVTDFEIIANGLHDLCICIDDKGAVNTGKIAKVPPERVLLKPLHDLLIVKLEPPIGTQRSLIAVIDETLKKGLEEIMHSVSSKPKKDPGFEMFGGDSYDFL